MPVHQRLGGPVDAAESTHQRLIVSGNAGRKLDTWEALLPRTAGNGRGLTMEVAIGAWILSGIISAVSATNNGRCTLSEFFIVLLLGPLGSARKSKHERHREMLEKFHAQRSKL